jgi:pyrroloquinoline quinone biosynthesis protein B
VAAPLKPDRDAMPLRILVLGSAAGGGFPQWNCRCPVCDLAWAGDRRVSPRTQSSLAVSADGERWLLLNASPDLRQQILAAPFLQPREPGRHSPIAGVVLTNGDVDHVAGLLTLRERQPLAIYATPAVQAVIGDNPIFRVLDPGCVRPIAVALDEPVEMPMGLEVTAFAVPGKVPLHQEGEMVRIGGETDATIGLRIAGAGAHFFYIPGCAAVTPTLLQRIQAAPLLLFDGTTYTDDEMVRLGLSGKTAHRMGHVAMSGPDGSIARLAAAAIRRKVYIHINNTNPVLVDGSAERRGVEAAGWEVAFDGMEIVL